MAPPHDHGMGMAAAGMTDQVSVLVPLSLVLDSRLL